MSLVFLLYAIVISTGMEAETPAKFLLDLSSCTADQWIEYQYRSDEMVHPDTVRAIIDLSQSLSVDPGELILEDVEGGYRAIFPESRWTWRMDGGRIGSVRGESIIEWCLGRYTWVELPIFTEDTASIGRRESICMGVTIMLSIGVLAIIVIWYAKRRYG